MPDRIRVSAAELARNIGLWQEKALLNPISITHHGRERLVLISSERYAQAGLATPETEKADQKIAVLNLRLAAVLDNIVEAYAVHDADMRIIDVNRVMEMHCGLTREQLIGRRFDELFSADQIGVYHKSVERVMRTGEVIKFEADSAARPGSRVELRQCPHPDGVVSLSINITENQRLTRELETVSAITRAAEAHRAIALIALDGRGKRLSSDKTFAEWTGFSEQHLDGRAFVDLLAPARRKAFLAALENTLSNRVEQELDVTLTTRQGEELFLHLSLAPVVAGFVVQGAYLIAVRTQSKRDAARVA